MGKLIRGLSLAQAVAINTTDMVGIGPFVTLPFIMGAMQGPVSILAWLFGAVLAFADGSVWAELGAKWPEAGGSYAFLRQLYGPKGGKFMSFLYTWQTSIQGPLVVASGAIGFSHYFTYLMPLGYWQQKAVSGILVIVITAMLCRRITDIGKISLVFGIIVLGTIGWIIISGFMHFDNTPFDNFRVTDLHATGISDALTKVIYCYLGYYNVCHLGAEIKNPEHNIPRSIFMSIAIIAVLYIFMQIAVLAVIPWQEAKDSPFIISLFFQKLYGPLAAQIATVLILLIAISSLFAVLLGYSRVPYAAAADDNFLPVFKKLHPTKDFPYVSLLVMGGLAFVFSLLFKLSAVISAIIVMRVLVQFVAQSVGLLAYHNSHKAEEFPFRMWLYPLPALVALLVWLFVFFSADLLFICGALGIMAIGALVFYLSAKMKSKQI